MSKLTPFFRKIKWYYILPIYLLGIGYGWYSMYQKQIIPAMTQVTNDKASWVAAQVTMTAALAEYDGSVKKQADSVKLFYDGYNKFIVIQNTMPEIYDMQSRYAAKDPATDRAALEEWYRIMGKGEWLTELKKWSDKYKLEIPPPVYAFGANNLGYNEQLPSAKIISQDFPQQTFHANGYADLVSQVRNRVGYGYCPLIITVGTAAAPAAAAPGAAPGTAPAPTVTIKKTSYLPQEKKTIWASTIGRLFAAKKLPGDEEEPAPAAAPVTPAAAPKPATPPPAPAAPAAPPKPTVEMVISLEGSPEDYNPSRPKVSLAYNCKGYFMTKGWNPVPDAQKKLADAIKLYDTVPPAKPATPPPGVAPKLLGMIEFPK